MPTPLSNSATGALLVSARLLFAGLITYFATQAHGWAGGYAADPRLTIAIWIGLSFTSTLWHDVRTVAVVALFTQVVVHIAGTSGCDMHHSGMMSSQQMLLAHGIVGTAAAVLMLNVEAAVRALGSVLDIVVGPLQLLSVRPILVTTESHDAVVTPLWHVHALRLRNLIEGRSPPVFA